MVDNDKYLTRHDISRLLHRLDDKLAQCGSQVVVYLVGGANMALTISGIRQAALMFDDTEPHVRARARQPTRR